MHIAHIQGLFSPEHGGPTLSLRNYATEQARRKHRVTVRALTGFKHVSPAETLDAPIDFFVGRVSSPRRLGVSPELKRKLREDPTPDIYHLHGAWLRGVYYGAAEAKRRDRPYVWELMGMYEPYGLNISRKAKAIARRWYQDRVLHQASCLHANSIIEAQNLRSLGFRKPIAVIPVGVDMRERESRLPYLTGTSTQSDGEGPFALFLARIHPKKGVPMLLQAWAAAAPGSDWKLVLAGSGDVEFVEECKSTASALGIAEQCVWTGHVSEEQKRALFRDASFYVLPTYSDNFANSVAEALAHELPVLTTTATPWQELAERGCGWISEPNPAAIADGLMGAFVQPPATLKRMGKIGAGLVQEKYSLEASTRKMEMLYEWILGGGPCPDFVLPGANVRPPRRQERAQSPSVVLTTNSISREAGGLFESVRALAQHLAREGVPLEVLSLRDEHSSTDAAIWAPVVPKVFPPLLPRVVRYSSELEAGLRSSTANILHSHGIWQYPSYVALSWKRRGRAHIVSPRGMLEPWARRFHGWKKLPIWHLFERRNLLTADAVHATSVQEAEHVRRLGYEGPIAVIPNGVYMPPAVTPTANPERERIALFLSRVHAKKGLHDLLRAWKNIPRADWKLVICGPGERHYLRELKELAAELQLEKSVTFVPGAYGSQKDDLFRRADLFVLPSYSENFGLAVAEALSWGVPVVTTKATPWAELELHRCGWWADTGASSLANSLQQAISLTDEERSQMGSRGRALVRNKYTWDRAVAMTLALYRWVLDGGEAPPFLFNR